jgi:uncharacterized ion transporter superfamily protein YfcC
MAHPATPASETAPRFHFPSAYTILLALIVIIAGLTWVIPAGQYERAASEALGKDVPVAGVRRQGFSDFAGRFVTEALVRFLFEFRRPRLGAATVVVG